ncbi:hypothetical protein [Halopseudomonas laoshanensis]|uniref:hypothetical protein n=1 Tax=Halopseudomonas laoshanensis TaxID=2268758 RepID=UPI003736B09A
MDGRKNIDKKKWLFRLAFFVCAVAIAEVVSSNFVGKDPYLQEVEAFAKSSPELKARYGNIVDIEVAQITRVASTPTERAYRLYALSAQGSIGSGVFEVTVLPPGNDSDAIVMRLGR